MANTAGERFLAIVREIHMLSFCHNHVQISLLYVSRVCFCSEGDFPCWGHRADSLDTNVSMISIHVGERPPKLSNTPRAMAEMIYQ